MTYTDTVSDEPSGLKVTSKQYNDKKCMDALRYEINKNAIYKMQRKIKNHFNQQNQASK